MSSNTRARACVDSISAAPKEGALRLSYHLVQMWGIGGRRRDGAPKLSAINYQELDWETAGFWSGI